MKKRIGVLVGVWVIEIIAFLRWFSCWQFKGDFYFTQQTLTNTLLDATNGDQGVPILITRALHNKVFAFLWGLTQTYLQYWDIRFLDELLGIVGGVGVFLVVLYLCTKNRKNFLVWSLLGILTLLILVELFTIPHISYTYRVLPMTIIFQVLSLFGIWQFLSYGNFRIRLGITIFLLILSLLSLWLQPQAYQTFCLKV